MTTFLIEKESASARPPGLTVPGKIEKMGYKGVDTTELVFEGYRTTDARSSAGCPARASTR
jgi:alkylation response protein AidB-like acyl-CoA dehydrogenase